MPTSRGHILIADDEAGIARLVSAYLKNAGYETSVVHDGADAMEVIRGGVDLAVLDVMMPGIDGFEIARRTRRFSDVPLILLTARGEEADRITGFRSGVDDYVVKPFSPRELVERVRAVLKRARGVTADSLRELVQGELRMDAAERGATYGGAEMVLTPMQFDILFALADAPGRVFSRDRLLELFGVRDGAETGRTIDVQIKNIRKALRRVGAPDGLIETRHGLGYCWSKQE